MRVTYEWTREEWSEAVRLAAERPHRGANIPGLTYALILVPLLGGGLEMLVHLRSVGTVRPEDGVLPLLLAAVCAVAWIAGVAWKRRRQRSSHGPMPIGTCEALLQEGGWRFQQTVLVPATMEHQPGGAHTEDNLPTESSAAEVSILTALHAEATPEESAHTMLSRRTEAMLAAELSPWSDMHGSRRGSRVVIFLHRSGFSGVPTRCLSEDQSGHLQRMMERKLRPSARRR